MVTNITIHPLLRPAAEAMHQLSGEGTARIDDDPELSPGLDCCAVCAGPLDDCPTSCTNCDSVHYCSPQHLIDDASNHAAVCEALRCMRHADRLLNSQILASEQKGTGSSGGSTAQSLSVVQQPELNAFMVPAHAQHGWEYVAPEKFLLVFPRSEHRGEEGEDAPAAKRPRKLDVDSAAATSQHGRNRAAQDAPDGPGFAGSPDGAGSAEAQLQLAVELAERTSTLSYAYTATYALQNIPAAREAARRAKDEGRSLELVVLGAAADAELGDISSWQVIAAALDQDVRIMFVGPEVSEHLASTEAQQGRVTMRFEQGTYEQGVTDQHGLQHREAPDIYFAFNPGFTCPDYDWTETVKSLVRVRRSPTGGSLGGGQQTSGTDEVPCLVVATNTSVEAQMEAEWLHEYGWRGDDPASPNPYTSLKLAQSGTLANDVYRKNAWLGVYKHRLVQSRTHRGRRSGKYSAKTIARRAAQVMYDAMIAPVARLLQKS
ncbi:hypothetical protein VaNZ11_013633 [Volvox africanus]|uniref:Mitochondrial splicing suppressor 51-like C-terminal domain-containing protein n=1 Tax=Volvox africanus TaxID=51714 RepID=A0ABQ5SHZ3_9CHLO|nr:hypothetical protein VaNZ11_013633 [Volvox africanus]